MASFLMLGSTTVLSTTSGLENGIFWAARKFDLPEWDQFKLQPINFPNQ
jgi:hypothetical protein